MMLSSNVERSVDLFLDGLVAPVLQPVAVSCLVTAARVVLTPSAVLLNVARVVVEQAHVTGREVTLGTGRCEAQRVPAVELGDGLVVVLVLVLNLFPRAVVHVKPPLVSVVLPSADKIYPAVCEE